MNKERTILTVEALDQLIKINDVHIHHGSNRFIGNIENTNAIDLRLRTKRIAHCAVKNTTFQGCDFNVVEFDTCDLSNVRFEKCKLMLVVFNTCTFNDVVIRNNDIQVSTLVNCTYGSLVFKDNTGSFSIQQFLS